MTSITITFITDFEMLDSSIRYCKENPLDKEPLPVKFLPKNTVICTPSATKDSILESSYRLLDNEISEQISSGKLKVKK